jgi:uncharacterized repeat protein (TIGR03803 family)
LLLATNGDFYGTTSRGGAYDSGTVFKITAKGVFTTMYAFENETDGSRPAAGLIQADDGAFYGTTVSGGSGGGGTIFKVTPRGALTTLYSFSGSVTGSGPNGGLLQATDGNFYGMTAFGGSDDIGTIFEITPSGDFTTLHSFAGGLNGYYPYGALVQGTDGKLYGVTEYGGTNDDGMVFSLSIGLGPFVRTLPTSAKVETQVQILGTDLTAATNVAFNGSSALFTVVSASEITATVPVGATTGPVQVVTPTGTLSSNVPFRVR